MAFFGVTIAEFERVWPHPNADRLDLAKLKGLGFQFVVARDNWRSGDRCLYFPIDALLTPELMLALGLVEHDPETGATKGRLHGPQRNRIKTAKLRGQISQGIVGSLGLIALLLAENPEPTAEEITSFLGVTKFEPELKPLNQDTGLIPLPDGLSMYDIEGADRYEAVATRMMDMPVAVTEKLEGSNFSVMTDAEGWGFVSQRRFGIRQDPNHPFWRLALDTRLIERCELIRMASGASTCALRGEFIGPAVQGNIYRLPKTEVRFFDIMLDNEYVGWERYCDLVRRFNLPHAPVLDEGRTLGEILAGRSIQEYSNGRSMLADVAREGVVIRPLVERFDEELSGRLLLKQRSPEYLAKSDN